MQNEKLDAFRAGICAFRFPRWNELPEIDLYMDQVVGYLGGKLAVFSDEDADNAITSTMINNYVKQKVIPAPVKKRYDRTCVASMIVLFCAKQVLSIGMTGQLLASVRMSDMPMAQYDRFCHIFETVLSGTVTETSDAAVLDALRREDALMTAVAVAFANKLYAEKLLLCMSGEEDTIPTEAAEHA